MNDEQFGTTADYFRAFEAVRAEGIPDKHLAMLRAHMAAQGYATTWVGLAEAVGYPTGSSVNLQYGKFAERVARKLGLIEKSIDPGGTGWWLWVLVRWADGRDPDSGHTVFVLRRPAIEALRQLGLHTGAAIELLPDELEADAPIREGNMRTLISSGSPYEPKVGISRAVRVGDVIAVSGTAPLGPDSRTVGPGDPAAQARRCLEIIGAALENAGASLKDVIRTRNLLVRIEDWQAVAAVHGEFFGEIRPANTIMQISRFVDPDWLVEFEADAVVDHH